MTDISMPAMKIYHQPVPLLQKLIQFDTTNPPGNEAACITFINELLRDAGIETKLLARSPERPNLIARLPGQGHAPPLLLYGHVDVVTTASQQWQHGDFSLSLIFYNFHVLEMGRTNLFGPFASLWAASAFLSIPQNRHF